MTLNYTIGIIWIFTTLVYWTKSEKLNGQLDRTEIPESYWDSKLRRIEPLRTVVRSLNIGKLGLFCLAIVTGCFQSSDLGNNSYFWKTSTAEYWSPRLGKLGRNKHTYFATSITRKLFAPSTTCTTTRIRSTAHIKANEVYYDNLWISLSTAITPTRHNNV